MAGKETDVTWALDLLAPDPTNVSVLGKYGGTLLGGLSGFATAFFVNWAGKRPAWSGIQKHIAYPIIFAGIAKFIEVKSAERVNERDAVYRHYITLHPDDFPEPERKKFSEILRPWIPVR